jgi:nicotinate-nucleotide adenylyltransferase
MTKKIGLLGGSFNPAHEGHLHISLQALNLLGLDEVWWLVSPQNPLKPTHQASFETRLNGALNITKEHRKYIKISDFEEQNGTNRTYDTIAALHNSHPDIKFIWLMGADNLINFHKWYKWQDIFNITPIAVLDRDDNKKQAMNSEAALSFKNNILPKGVESNLTKKTPPTWCFLDIPKHPASSSEIRNKLRI